MRPDIRSIFRLAGGTHPTGMLSCSCVFWFIEVLYVIEEMRLILFVLDVKYTILLAESSEHYQ